MQKCSQKDRWEFIHLMMKHATITPANVTADCSEIITEYDVQQIAIRLLHYGATYGRIQEFDCNAPDARYGQDEYNKRMQEAWNREQERLHKKEEKIVERVEKLCAKIGCKAIFQGDPRGNTIKVQMPDGFTNDWGKEGICVPTS
jgi:hypothetical protein